MFVKQDTNVAYGGGSDNCPTGATTTLSKTFLGAGGFGGLRKGMEFGAVMYLNVTVAIQNGGSVIFSFGGTDLTIPLPSGLAIGKYRHEVTGFCWGSSSAWVTAPGSAGSSPPYSIGTPPAYDFKVQIAAGTGTAAGMFASTWVK